MGFWSITKKYLGVKLETNDSYLRGIPCTVYIHVITTYCLLSVRLSSSFSLGEFSRMSPPAYDWCYEQPGGLELRKYHVVQAGSKNLQSIHSLCNLRVPKDRGIYEVSVVQLVQWHHRILAPARLVI